MSTYHYGREVLGAGDVTIGLNVREWDNHATYQLHEVVYWDGKFWMARRQVDPPWIPAFMDGDVPGKSDAWNEISYERAYADTINGELENLEELAERLAGEYDEDVFGVYDLQQIQRNLNDLKPVTVEIARVLLRAGQQIIAQAMKGAELPWYKTTTEAFLERGTNLPGVSARKNVQDHLQWHADALAKISGDPYAAYAPGNDLKKYVVEAFVEANAVEEGAAWIEAAWQAMWVEIQTKLAAMPRAALAAAASATGGALSALTGVPMWALVAGGVVLTAGVAYVGYKVATGPAGGAIVHAYIGRRAR